MAHSMQYIDHIAMIESACKKKAGGSSMRKIRVERMRFCSKQWRNVDKAQPRS